MVLPPGVTQSFPLNLYMKQYTNMPIPEYEYHNAVTSTNKDKYFIGQIGWVPYMTKSTNDIIEAIA